MIYGLLMVAALMSGALTILSKFIQKSLHLDFTNFLFYNFVNAAFGSVFLLSACSFQPQLNVITVSYALVYAVIVFISLVATTLFLSENPVSLLSLTNTAGSIIPSALLGILLLKEPFTLKLAFSVLLMLTALVLPYLKTNHKNFNPKTVLFCILLFANSGAGVILIKLFSLCGAQAHAPSMFFLTNAFLFCICGVVFLIKRILTKQKCGGFALKQYIYIGSSTCISNLLSILSAYILANMAISTYTVLNSSLTLLSGALISVLLFREKSTRENSISLVLAIAAIVLSV